MKPSILFFALLIAGCTFQKQSEITYPELYNLGSRIDYQVAGGGDTTLLFVHGWCIDQTYWEDQVDFFKDQYKVVTVDLPGHGKSDKNREDWSIGNFGKDIVMLMDALDLKNVVLIGHSMGGNVILEAANAKPDAVIGFVGVDNFKDLAVVNSEADAEQMANFMNQARMDYKGVVGGYVEGMLFSQATPKEISKRVMKDILSTPPDISIGMLESLNGVNQIEGRQMRKLKLKVHLINCDGYPTNENQLRKYCTYSYEIHSIGSLGHYPMVEDPDKFNSVLSDVLKAL